MKLISMTDYVLNVPANIKTTHEKLLSCVRYANFLKQPLTLGMFVPCDEEGNVLEEPFGYMKWLTVQGGIGGKGSFSSEFKQYQKAEDRVLFEGFVVDNKKGQNVFFTDKLGKRWHKGNANMNHSANKNRAVKDIISLFGSDNNMNTIEDLPNYVELTKSAIKQLGL